MAFLAHLSSFALAVEADVHEVALPPFFNLLARLDQAVGRDSRA